MKYEIKMYKGRVLKEDEDAIFFYGHSPDRRGVTKKCLSQWWVSDTIKSDFEEDGIVFDCMERYMMYHKALLFGDEVTAKNILLAETQKEIKALGREVKPFDGVKWGEYNRKIVVRGNYLKFSQNPALREFLLSTGDKLLIEASPYDKIWGIGLKNHECDVDKWKGTNYLGFSLMEARDYVREGSLPEDFWKSQHVIQTQSLKDAIKNLSDERSGDMQAEPEIEAASGDETLGKIVIMTGTFNPPTRAHLNSIVKAMDVISADRGYIVPTSYEYLRAKMLRAGDGFVPDEEIRNRMLSAMCSADKRLVLGEQEGENGTYEDIKKIAKKYPGAQIYYLGGADKLKEIPNWRNAERLLSDIKIIVLERAGSDVRKIINSNDLLRRYEDNLIIVSELEEEGDISSTAVRRLFKSGDGKYRDYLIPEVAEILAELNPADYQDPDFAETIKALKKKGRFGVQKALKRVYEANAEAFAYIEGQAAMISGTKVYRSEICIDESGFGSAGINSTHIGCVNENQVAVAERLTYEGLNPAILSTASRVKACGGYASGEENNTEEELCRCSNLSQSLYQFGNPRLKAVKESGVIHMGCAYPLDIRFGGIYSPGVTFFRNGKRDNYSMRDSKFICSVISVASLSNRQVEKDRTLIEEKQYFDGNGCLTEEGGDIEKDKIRTAFRIAASNGHDSLVIGDFGIKHNIINGRELAELFSQVLSEAEFKERFKAIDFSFDEGRGTKRYPVEENGKFGGFYELFGRI